MNTTNILIRNEYFSIKNNSHTSVISKIGVRGFAVFSFLLLISTYGITVTSAGQIMSYLGISKTKEISQILSKLSKLKAFATKDNLDAIKKNTIIELDFTKYLDESMAARGYTLIPRHIFQNHIKKIGFSGWAVYCLLYRLHTNPSFSDGPVGGYAHPSEAYMAIVLKLHKQTVHKATETLAKQGLIWIVKSGKSYKGIQSNDKGNHNNFRPSKLYIVIDKKNKIENMRRKMQ